MPSHQVATSVESAAAGFIVWLARQRPPGDQRRYAPGCVERFLCWQHLQRGQGADHSEEDYHARLGTDPSAGLRT
jgi:hypothetical protein